jgi:hypothetical protein
MTNKECNRCENKHCGSCPVYINYKSVAGIVRVENDCPHFSVASFLKIKRVLTIWVLTIVFVMSLKVFVFAGQIAYGEIKNVSQYSQLQELKTKANNFLKNQSQPAEMFGYRYFPISDIAIFWGQKQILMNIDVVVNAYGTGKIELIGIRKYNRKGYIRDSEFYEINSRIQELNSYEVEVSTP